mmetsp:Transcript_17732/g.32806  ORF Transcript_17732/g.32806 Transcript_17732/m.32806 type:complete len:101 (+) Transcript_17732:112-414(+)
MRTWFFSDLRQGWFFRRCFSNGNYIVSPVNEIVFPIVPLFVHAMGQQFKSAARTRIMSMKHPTVKTFPMVNVGTISRQRDFVMRFKVLQADAATCVGMCR